MAAWKGKGGEASRRLSRLKRSATSRRATCGGPIHIGNVRHGRRKKQRDVTRRDAKPEVILGDYTYYCPPLYLHAVPRVARVLGFVIAPRRSVPVRRLPSSTSYRVIPRCDRGHVRHLAIFTIREKRKRKIEENVDGPRAGKNVQAGAERG